MTAVPTSEHKIEDLQALRGVSILLVLFQHFEFPAAVAQRMPVRVSPFGWMGVEIFFVISGYVIIRALGRDRYEPFSFLVKRLFRLTPAVLLFLALSAAVNAFYRGDTFPAFARTQFSLPWAEWLGQAGSILGGYFTLRSATPVAYSHGAMWSLSVEDLFYFALAVVGLLPAVVARVGRWPAVARVTPWLVGGLSAVLLAAVTACRIGHLFGNESWRSLPLLTYLVQWKFDFLAAGILTAYADSAFRHRIAAWVATRGNSIGMLCLLAPLALAAVSEGVMTNSTRLLTGFTLPVALVCFSAVVLIAGHNRLLPEPRGRITRLLTYFGDRSYTIYLFHFPLMAAVWSGWYWAFPKMLYVRCALLSRFPGSPLFDEKYWDLRFGVYQAAATMLILLPLVEVVYHWVENPLTRFGRELGKKVRILPPEPTAPEAVTRPMPELRAA